MTMQKLRGIRNTGTYTAQRSIVEKLLLIEEEIATDEELHSSMSWGNADLEIRIARERMQTLVRDQFKRKNIREISNDDFRHYLQSVAGQIKDLEKSQSRGCYSSELFHYVNGEDPFEIDLENKPCEWLFFGLDHERTLHIQNLFGDCNFRYAGAEGNANIIVQNLEGNQNFGRIGNYHGHASIAVQKITGDNNFDMAGQHHGNIIINAQQMEGNKNFEFVGMHSGNTTIEIKQFDGQYNFPFMGTHHGLAHITIEDFFGERNFSYAGGINGDVVIVAKNFYGMNNFTEHESKIILYNTEPPKKSIEGITRRKRKQLLTLIEQNVSPEDIMAYLVKK